MRTLAAIQREINTLTEQIIDARQAGNRELVQTLEWRKRKLEDEKRRARAGAPPCPTYDPDQTVHPSKSVPVYRKVTRLYEG